jgi:hypothetical protein
MLEFNVSDPATGPCSQPVQCNACVGTILILSSNIVLDLQVSIFWENAHEFFCSHLCTACPVHQFLDFSTAKIV